MIRVFVKLLLIFVLSYAGVKIWYDRLEEKLLVVSVPEVSVSEQVAAVKEEEPQTESLRKPDDYTIIVARNIFQAVITEPVKVEQEVEPEDLEPTKLKLSLKGTISGSDRNARAIIADDLKKKQDIYQVGDSLQGALILSIERGRVILQVNGVDEVLSLKERKGGGPAYKPSASDFYREPPEARQDTLPTTEVEARKQVRKPPVVRPRPVRRSPGVPGGRN